MESSLLATKLRIPSSTHQMVRRQRLIDVLERGIHNHKLVLISAPAGFGKTTLIAQWAQFADVPVAWLTVEAEDNDADRFLRYLLRAWETVQPDVKESRLGLLLGAIAPAREAVLAAFINIANDLPGRLVFVLDDAHLIEEPAIHQALAYLLDHLPPTLCFVLAGRAEPPLPVARYRVRHDLLELRAEDLQFSLDETGEFLKRCVGLELDAHQIGSLHAQVEGWAAGLQLASLGFRRSSEMPAPLLVTGRHRFVADYLSQDVLASLPEDRREFLLQTSILDRLCGPLCDAVTGQDGGQAMLEALERANLFLTPLDENREWYRYHWLFADFLREELHRRHPNEVADLHRRATNWYLVHDLPEPAFDHALATSDPELVIRILEQYAPAKLHTGEVNLVGRWLDAIPVAWYSAHPLLDLFRAGRLAFTGAFDDCLRCIDDVEQRLVQSAIADARRQLAMVFSVRCFIACTQNDLPQAERYADWALRDLRDESLFYRASVFHALGDTYRRHGRWQEAKASYHKALSFTNWPGHRIQSAHVYGALADLELRQGRLRNAANYWRQALAVIQDQVAWGHLPLPVVGWVFIRMGELLYEWNDLSGAWGHLARGLERSELGGDVRALIAGHVIAARLELTEGDTAAAAEHLEQAQPLVEQASFPDWTSRFERCQLDLWLAQNRRRAALDWCSAMLEGSVLEARPESESAQLALAHAVLTVKGDAPARERALARLARLRQAAAAEGRMGVQIEALALQGLAAWQAGDRAGAMAALEQALRLAEPEGYLRLFADFGLPMARLLQEARSRRLMPAYVDALLRACGDISLASGVETILPEPLSAREQEVLRLIAAGLTNREIAETLAISSETVKKHAGNIFGKLGVDRRTEAVAKARDLALLE